MGCADIFVTVKQKEGLTLVCNKQACVDIDVHNVYYLLFMI